MKTLCVLVLKFLFFAGLPAQSADAPPSTNQISQLEGRVRKLLALSDVDGSALVELGLERAIADRQQGLHCILTLTDDIELAKYSDGTFTLVVLPREGTSQSGIERFAWAYNEQVIRDADSRLKRGELDFAEKTYRLLLKHCPLTGYDRQLRARLDLVAMARKGAGRVDVAALEKLEPNEPGGVYWTELSTKKATMVTNLFEVKVKDLVISLTEEETERKSPPESQKGASK